MHGYGVRVGSTVVAIPVMGDGITLAGLQQPITAMVTLVDDVDFPSVLIQKHVEIVVD